MYDGAEDGRRSYKLAIDDMRERLEATPKVQIGDATLYCGDSLLIVPTLGMVDALVTDPPYSSGGTFRSDRAKSTQDKYIGNGYVNRDVALLRPEFSGDNKDQRSYFAWCSVWLNQCKARVPLGGLCLLFTDWRQLPTASDALQSGGWFWRGIVVWDKTEAARPQKGWFRNQCEYVIWGSNGQMTEGGKCHPGVFRQSVLAEGKDHIAGKPLAVMDGLLRIVPENGIVLDPFMGSGTTGVACAKLGRRFIGIEIEPRYFDIACRRIEEAYAQPDLFVERSTEPEPQQEVLSL